MKFEPNEEQAAILDALTRLVARFNALDSKSVVQRFLYARDLEDTLRNGGFFEIGGVDAESRVTSALIVAEIAKLPVCVEIAASLLTRPLVCPDSRGPIALIWGKETAPTRFLPQAKTAIIVGKSGGGMLEIAPDDFKELESVFAYPIGRLMTCALPRVRYHADFPLEILRTTWQIGIALEIYGALHAAVNLTIDHVTQRRQFGQPLGSFQAIQHRLAMDVTTIEAIRWLAIRAAYTADAGDAAMAAGYAQRAVNSIVYNVHQFSGAMGLTLEYPLHLFTYRARMLQSEGGGAYEQLEAAALHAWPNEHGNSLQRTELESPLA